MKITPPTYSKGCIEVPVGIRCSPSLFPWNYLHLNPKIIKFAEKTGHIHFSADVCQFCGIASALLRPGLDIFFCADLLVHCAVGEKIKFCA